MTTMHAPAKSASSSGTSGRIYNFGAGPSVLPEEVIRQIQEDVWNYKGCGMGVLEISHRGKQYDAMIAEIDKDLREVGGIPANYRILFMTGGASSQNYIVPANLLPKGGTADYIITGYWGEKSAEDAQQYAKCHNAGATVHIAGTSKDKNHSYIPGDDQIRYSARPAYVHLTSNNTIYGTQWKRVPAAPAGVPLVCDASSDIFSEPIDVTKYGVIYGGAQKNLGTTGTTFVIIRDDLVAGANKDIPKMLQYGTFAKDESRPNTPPTFAIYTVGLMAKWIKKQGGLKALAAANAAKAKLIYDVLDGSAYWKPHARKDSRSLMNITFRLGTEALEEKFLSEAKAQGIDGIKGHRATGGMRVSIYNAFPKAGCEAMAQFMKDFEKRNG